MTPLPDGTGYRFRHDLVREGLLQSMPPVRSMQLHARVGELLEERYGGSAPDHATELLMHFECAAPVTGLQPARRYAALAARAATAQHAYQDAAVLFDRALAGHESEPMGREIAELILERARVGVRVPLPKGAQVRSLSNAFRFFESEGDTDATTSLALTIPPPFCNRQSPYRPLLVRALANATEGSEAHRRLRLLLAFGDFQDAGDADRFAEEARAVVDEARRRTERQTEADTLRWMIRAFEFAMDHVSVLEGAEELRTLGDGVSDPLLSASASSSGYVAAAESGRTDRAARWHALQVSLAQRYGSWMTRAVEPGPARGLLVGDWETARLIAEETIVRKAILGAHRPSPDATSALALIASYTGDHAQELDRFEAELSRLCGGTGSRPVEEIVLARIGLMAAGGTFRSSLPGWIADAAGAQRVVALPPRRAMLVAAASGLLAARDRREEEVGAAYETIVAVRGCALLNFWGPFCVDRVLGHLAVAAGDFDAGVGHFEGALAQCRTAGFRAEAALTRAGLAGALLARAAATEGGDDAEEDDARPGPAGGCVPGSIRPRHGSAAPAGGAAAAKRPSTALHARRPQQPRSRGTPAGRPRSEQRRDQPRAVRQLLDR